MSVLKTVLAVVAFLGFFAVVEYATYRVMEREHEKRGIYQLFFMLAWTILAMVHMWVITALLDFPPSAVVALGIGILIVHIAGGLGVPILDSVGTIGLYPFALVYQLFVVLLLLAEGMTIVASSISQLSFLSVLFPSDTQVQAALGLGIAALAVAVTYYDPQGENGYYYATGRYFRPSVDRERISQVRRADQPENNSVEDSTHIDELSIPQHRTTEGQQHSEASRARVEVPTSEELEYNWTRSNISFDDVAGYYDVKERLAEAVLQPVQAAARGDNRYDRFGIEPSRGILFYGPPGTGKTMFARALAGELDIPFVELGPADVTSKWINEGPQRIRQLFEEADSIGPCVIFLDEAEHLFGGRDVGAGGAHAEDRKITSELLVHLTAEDRTAIVVGATNRPEDIDPAILRPGRLATHVEIGLPGEESRHAILQAKLKDVPQDLTGDQLAQLASHTTGFSGADIEDLVTKAKRRAARRDAQTVSVDDFLTREEHETVRKDDYLESTADMDKSSPENVTDDDSTVGFQ